MPNPEQHQDSPNPDSFDEELRKLLGDAQAGGDEDDEASITVGSEDAEQKLAEHFQALKNVEDTIFDLLPATAEEMKNFRDRYDIGEIDDDDIRDTELDHMLKLMTAVKFVAIYIQGQGVSISKRELQQKISADTFLTPDEKGAIMGVIDEQMAGEGIEVGDLDDEMAAVHEAAVQAEEDEIAKEIMTSRRLFLHERLSATAAIQNEELIGLMSRSLSFMMHSHMDAAAIAETFIQEAGELGIDFETFAGIIGDCLGKYPPQPENRNL